MTLEEFKKNAQEIEDWAPGWEAIDKCLETLYHGQEPRHFASLMPDRAIFGGNQFLDGFSVYNSKHGYLHIISYGMSELYAVEDSFGGEWSKWGYEMTIRLPVSEEADYMWAIDLLANLARYTFTTNNFFAPGQFFPSKGIPIKESSNSKLTGLLIVDDPELPGVDTLYGRLVFLQIVGITQAESDALLKADDENYWLVLAENIRKTNPYFITDLDRTVDFG